MRGTDVENVLMVFVWDRSWDCVGNMWGTAGRNWLVMFGGQQVGMGWVCVGTACGTVLGMCVGSFGWVGNVLGESRWDCFGDVWGQLVGLGWRRVCGQQVSLGVVMCYGQNVGKNWRCVG